MKYCPICKKEKDLSEFGPRKDRGVASTQSYCKPCALEKLRKHRVKMRNLVNRWKQIRGCSNCGFKGHPCQLDLDHVDPRTKHKNGNSRAYDTNWSKQRIKEELSKCVILCANCHRLKTYQNEEYLSVCDSPAHDENYI